MSIKNLLVNVKTLEHIYTPCIESWHIWMDEPITHTVLFGHGERPYKVYGELKKYREKIQKRLSSCSWSWFFQLKLESKFYSAI